MCNFFLVAVVLYAVLISEATWTLSISNKDLEDLETLIQSYKRVAAAKTQANSADFAGRKTFQVNRRGMETTENPQEAEASRVGLRIMAKENAKHCGMQSRVTYELCNKNAVNKGDEEGCASTFVDAYEKCYFGNSLLRGNSKDLMHCSGSCLWNFDNCLVNSNKIEMFICINARNACSARCPWPSNNVSRKRTSTNCDSVCQGRFDQCYDVIKLPHEVMLCNVNRHHCRQSSTCEIEK